VRTITLPKLDFEVGCPEQIKNEKLYILNALAVAYVKAQKQVKLVGVANAKQPPVHVGGIDDAKVLSLSTRSGGNFAAQHSFSLAVHFNCERTFFAPAVRYKNHRMLFVPKRHRFKDMETYVHYPVTFTGDLSPLFNFFVEQPINPRNTRSS